MDLNEAQRQAASWLHDTANTFQKVPGSAVIIRYVQSSYQNDPIRSAIELVLVIFFIRYLLKPSYPTHRQNFIKLRDDEVDELVDEWVPEPLVAPLTTAEETEIEKLPIIIGPSGPKTKLSNGRTVTNLACYNFYNLASNDQITDKAIQTLRIYGVGPCGPPQFYGTQDVHMKIEADIASFLGTESCVVYSQAFSTMSSVIPAFCKRGDVILADRDANYSIKKGLEVSRSNIRWFNHCDMEDLERLMWKVEVEQEKKNKTRRFIVTEGLFEATGETIDLPKLIELKEKYKFRIILDETWSFGVLGRTGRGVTEAQNVDPTQIDMIAGSLAGPLCASGGFCAGSKDVVEHQRVASPSYTFSAAVPAMTAVTASEAINLLQSNPEIIAQCRENIKVMTAQLDPRSDWVKLSGADDNPTLLLTLKPEVVQARRLSLADQDRIILECVDECLANGVLITRLKGIPILRANSPGDDSWRVKPALKVQITSGLTRKEIEKAGITIRHAITKVMTRKTSIKALL